MKRALVINTGFALRQVNGLPVFTEERRFKKIDSKADIKKAIELIKEHKHGKIILVKNQKGKTSPENIKGKIDHPFDISKVKRIILTPKAKGYISTAFLEFTKEHFISILWIDKSGRIEATYTPFYNRRSELVLKQSNAALNGKSLDIAKYIILLKLQSQGMKHLEPTLRKTKNLKEVIQLESNASKWYLNEFMFPDRWNWTGRHGKNNIQHLKAVDPINAMLNLGYNLLAQQMSEILIKRGFEPSIGFLHVHSKQFYWNQLSYDMIEPFRVIIDNAVTDMVHNKEVRPSDFTFSKRKEQMVFKKRAFKIALGKFMEVLKPLEHKSLPMIRKIEEMLK